MDTQQTVGDRIRRYRESKNWSKIDLARASQLHENTIAKIEAGDSDIRMSTIGKIAHALCCPESFLLGLDQ